MSSPSEPWSWADVGFDTAKKLWFVRLNNHKGMVQIFIAKNIILKNGYGVQYQWPDEGPRDGWHVRERIYANEVKSIEYDADGNLVVDSVRVEAMNEDIPQNYSYICYAYSLKTSRGFVEFYDANNKLLKKINEKWIIVEDLNRKTIGEFPQIRIRVERENIRKILVTKSAVIIEG